MFLQRILGSYKGKLVLIDAMVGDLHHYQHSYFSLLEPCELTAEFLRKSVVDYLADVGDTEYRRLIEEFDCKPSELTNAIVEDKDALEIFSEFCGRVYPKFLLEVGESTWIYRDVTEDPLEFNGNWEIIDGEMTSFILIARSYGSSTVIPDDIYDKLAEYARKGVDNLILANRFIENGFTFF